MGSGFGGARPAGRAGVTRPKVIGVTGGIATGKSAVLSILSGLGAAVIDADQVYHRLIEPGQALNDTLVAQFGPEIRLRDGAIDRAALGRIVFADLDALARLDAVAHPAVIADIERQIEASPAAVVAIDAVKLLESGMDRLCDRVWLVAVERDIQIGRLMKRNHLDRDEAVRRIDAQRLSDEDRARVDVLIDNSGVLGATRAQVVRLWREFAELSIRE